VLIVLHQQQDKWIAIDVRNVLIVRLGEWQILSLNTLYLWGGGGTGCIEY
jgi:hypothetical protein